MGAAFRTTMAASLERRTVSSRGTMAIIIDVQDVTKRFGNVLAVDRCSLKVEKGSITGLIGPNGAGKTTMFNMVAGAFAPSSGRILLDGEDVTGFPAHLLFRRGLLRTFQIAQEFSTMTALENLMMVPAGQSGERLFNAWFQRGAVAAEEAGTRRRAEDVLQLLRLAHVRNELAGNLSGGQKKLLELGRVMMANPRVVLLVRITREITNVNRSFGALISGEIAQYYGDKGLASDTIRINLTGISGQALGAFLVPGVSLYLEGVANDYIGKGMHGGKIIIKSSNEGEKFAAGGNTCLYGATGGKLYISGSVGERFGVRNSGALAVVEGTGDNACEYMTGGVVVILGRTGINFGAGMTGGISFVYDADHTFIENVNRELVEPVRIDTDDSDEARHYLKRLLKDYLAETGSKKAKALLENFRVEVRNFWLVKPKNLTKLPMNLEIGD